MNDQVDAKIKLTGLWKKTASNGNVYLSGPMSGSSVLMVFPNTRKNGERDPDYLCYMYPRVKKDAEDKSFTQQPQEQAAPVPHKQNVDDIPF